MGIQRPLLPAGSSGLGSSLAPACAGVTAEGKSVANPRHSPIGGGRFVFDRGRWNQSSKSFRRRSEARGFSILKVDAFTAAPGREFWSLQFTGRRGDGRGESRGPLSAFAHIEGGRLCLRPRPVAIHQVIPAPAGIQRLFPKAASFHRGVLSPRCPPLWAPGAAGSSGAADSGRSSSGPRPAAACTGSDPPAARKYAGPRRLHW